MKRQTPIYLDHAAATPLDPAVLQAMMPYLTTEFYNPSATYLHAKKVRSAIADARTRTAQALGVRPSEIIFTAGATEANNIAVHGVMNSFPHGKLLISAIEHSSVLEPAKHHESAIIPVNEAGQVSMQALKELIDDSVVLISIMYANNEIGTVQNLSAVRTLITTELDRRQRVGNNTPLYLHTDAAQAPNLLPIFAKRLGVDLMSLNGSKMYGPKQSGALYIATGTQITALMQGGGQEFGMRSGTENVAGCVGFSHALEAAVAKRHQEEKRMTELRDYFYKEITKTFPVAVITSPRNGLFSLVHVVFPETDNERLMMELDEQGIMCAVGSACSASNDEPSHVLRAIGMTDQQAQSSLRFTMGRATTKADIDRVIAALKMFV